MRFVFMVILGASLFSVGLNTQGQTPLAIRAGNSTGQRVVATVSGVDIDLVVHIDNPDSNLRTLDLELRFNDTVLAYVAASLTAVQDPPGSAMTRFRFDEQPEANSGRLIIRAGGLSGSGVTAGTGPAFRIAFTPLVNTSASELTFVTVVYTLPGVGGGFPSSGEAGYVFVGDGLQIFPPAGSFESPIEVAMHAAGSDFLRYSIDGSVPTADSGTLFVEPFIVTGSEETKTVRAFASFSGMSPLSDEVQYTFVTPLRAEIIGGVMNGQVTNQDVTPEFLITGETSRSILLNSEEFTAGATISDEGQYDLVVTAVNGANMETDSVSFTIDKTPPGLEALAVVSDNSIAPDDAIVGDTVSVIFRTDGTESQISSAVIGGVAAGVVGAGAANTFEAARVMNAGDDEGIVAFAITIRDTAGNEAVASTATDGSAVSFVAAEWERIYTFDKGWNLISFPGPLLSNQQTAGSVFPGFSGSMWMWCRDDERLEMAQMLHPQTGYWLYADALDPAVVRGVEVDPDPDLRKTLLQEKWNLVGFSLSVSEASVSAADVRKPIWVWSGRVFEAVDQLARFKGYWIFSNNVLGL